MKQVKVFCLAGFVLAVTACGGGGSDSGGGTSKNAQAFSGTEDVTVSFKASGIKNSGVLKIDASVSDDSIIIVDIGNNQYSGSITVGNTFSATGIQSLGEIAPGINCGNITVQYSGSINGNTITGSSQGSVTCTGKAGSFTLSQKGTFSLTLS